MKVNFVKGKWIFLWIFFLGYYVEGGKLSLKKCVQKEREAIGEVETIHDIERIIGIISYARRVIWKIKEVLAPLWSNLKAFKKRRIL